MLPLDVVKHVCHSIDNDRFNFTEVDWLGVVDWFQNMQLYV